MKKVKLGDLFQVNNENINLHDYEFINYLDTGNITENKINNIQYLNILKDKIPSRAKRKVNKNTIIYSSVRPIQKHYGIIKQPFENMVVSTGFVTLDIVDEKNYDTQYMYFNLTQNKYVEYLQNIAENSTSSYPSITPSDLENLEISIHKNKEEQQKIAFILSSLDDKIELNSRIAGVLEKMMREIYDYWFVQFDFPDENGKPYQSNGGKMTYNPQLKRNIPQGWEVKKLGDLFDITMGSSPKGHSLNENGKGIEFYQGSTDFGRLYPTIRVFTTAPVRFAKSQDILMSVRAPVGAMNIAMNDCCIGRGLAAIRHQSPLFAWYTMQTFKSYFDTFNGNGTTFGSLTSDNLKEQLTVAPDKSILQMFIEKTQSVGEKLKTITMENRQLTALRDFLLPLLMNGQASVQ